jgi:WD40 repeat protein
MVCGHKDGKISLWSLKSIQGDANYSNAKIFGENNQPIVSLALDSDNIITSLLRDGEINKFDMRMEKILQVYKDDSIMEQF